MRMMEVPADGLHHQVDSPIPETDGFMSVK